MSLIQAIHYIKPSLKNLEDWFEIAILKVGSNADLVSNNIMNIANKYKNYGIINIFASGLTMNFVRDIGFWL